MAYYIKKPGVLTSGDVYYKNQSIWTQTFAHKTTYTQEAANAMIANPDGRNGGFVGATVVSE